MPPPAGAADSRVEGSATPSVQTILIIDDSPAFRASIEATLRDHGIGSKIVLETDGLTGFKRLLNEHIDLVLCDVVMPGLDGFKFLSLKAARPELSEIPVLMVTAAETDVGAKVRGLRAGASDYVAKPFDPEELVARVRVHLKIKALQDELRQKNKLLDQLSRTDDLTRIANRRMLDEFLAREYSRAVRLTQPLAVVMVDIDHFKQFNDNWGHAIGDLVLAAVASTLAGGMRPYDLVARYGGEEFVLVMPQSPADVAVVAAERLLQAIRVLKVQTAKGALSVTVSMGVAAWPDVAVESAAELLKHADGALYAAKQAGRDRVKVAAATGSGA
jgi:two-component system, cell cycle response regulator